MYRDFLRTELDKSKEALSQATAEDAVKQAQIADVQKFDEKLNLARELLDNHVSPTRIFEELEKTIKETVRFTSFSYEYEPGFDDITIDLSAHTKELDSVYLQKHEYLAEDSFREFLLSGISVTDPVKIDGTDTSEQGVSQEEPGVDFSVKGTFDKKLFTYKGDIVIGGDNTPATTTSEVGTTTPVTPSATTSDQVSNTATP